MKASDLISEMQSGMPYEWYERQDGERISHLKLLDRSPQHYIYGRQHSIVTRPLRLGRASHTAVLEPERFAAEYLVWRGLTKNGTPAARNPKHKKYAAFLQESAGRTILDQVEERAALTIQQAVRTNADAMRYLAAGDAELTLLWPIRGRQCKGRVDWLAILDGRYVIVGLKTARNCTLFPFSTAAAKLLYHAQWAWYHDGFHIITGEVPRLVEIVVESAAPHAVVVYTIPDEVIQQGREVYERLLMLLEQCEHANQWPGPAPGEVLFSLPTWAYHTQDDLSDLGLETA